MPKQKKTNRLYFRLRLVACSFALAGLVGGSLVVHADQYDNQINALQQQSSVAQNEVNSLQSQASSYQNAIAVLQGQISALQSALAINEAKQASDQAQIVQAQQNIIQQKALLAAEVRSLYIDGQLTTIEELATSKSLSDYVDKQTYTISVQNKINGMITQIANLETQLQQQKAQLTILINTQNQQNDLLASDESQQQSLLNYNQAQQASYNQQIQSNQSQIATLRAEQIAANSRLVSNGGRVDASGSCGGSYPAVAINQEGGQWGCNYPLDNTIDNWGMYNRECVSYTAWMVYKTYGYMPYWGGSGNANEWPGDAEAAGIPVGNVPKPGSVAIYMGGSGDPYGHAMWVDSVSGNMITVQQYNLYYDGNYYQTTINDSGLVYIYFGE